jgi:hypothetical protein
MSYSPDEACSQFSRQCLSICIIPPPWPSIFMPPLPAAAPGAGAPIAATGYSTSTVPAGSAARRLHANARPRSRIKIYGVQCP